jgi:hypothetical protein
MKRPTPKQAIVARCNDFTISIKILLDAKHTVPALVLLYSAIDCFGSLVRPETEANTNSGHFKKWAEDYMIGPSRLLISSEDLWGARCGALHSNSPSSGESRQGRARQLAYYRDPSPNAETQRALEPMLNFVRTRGQVPVSVYVLYAALEDGVRRFLADIEHDPELEKRAAHHCSKLFGVLKYGG